MLQPRRVVVDSQMTNVKARRDFARQSIVAIERDRAKDPVSMSGRLAFGDDHRSISGGLGNSTRLLGVVDLLNQYVALDPQTGHD